MRELATPGVTTPEPRKDNTYEMKLLILMTPPGVTTTLRRVTWMKNKKLSRDLDELHNSRSATLG
jgi:hypothetical protein